MKWLAAVWRRFRDFQVTLRTRNAIGERECRHDGTYPRCQDCDRRVTGW